MPGNMIVGFTNMVASVWDVERPRTVFVGFDSIGSPTYRNELLPEYQSGRDFPPELTGQLDRLPELVAALGFRWAKAPGYEADDFLAAAVRAEAERGGEALVLTSDRDMFQLAGPTTTILVPKRGVRELERVGPAEVRESYGVDPEQVPDFIALRGDPSDRIPGATGSAQAARPRSSSSTARSRPPRGGRLPRSADALRDYRRIATLQADAPIPELPDVEPDWASAADLAESWGHGGLAQRLRDRA